MEESERETLINSNSISHYSSFFHFFSFAFSMPKKVPKKKEQQKKNVSKQNIIENSLISMKQYTSTIFLYIKNQFFPSTAKFNMRKEGRRWLAVAVAGRCVRRAEFGFEDKNENLNKHYLLWIFLFVILLNAESELAPSGKQ